MANRLRGEARFTENGREYTLLFDAEAFLEIEDRTGESVFMLLADGDANIKLGTMATVLQAGLRRHHAEIDRAEAADILLAVPEAQEAMLTALQAAMPAQADAGNRPRRPARAAKGGTGKKS